MSMSNFGNAGTRTARVDIDTVLVHLSVGEYLSYKVVAKGAEAVFTFACAHRLLKAANQFPGHPMASYDWKWFKNPGEGDASQDIYGVQFSFASAVKYTLRIEHRNAQDGLIQLLQDIDYESQDPKDWYQEPLEVFLV
jgi:hypothetical protein